MKRNCEKCECPLTLLRITRNTYEKNKICARCFDIINALPQRWVARIQNRTETVEQMAAKWMDRVKTTLREKEGS